MVGVGGGVVVNGTAITEEVVEVIDEVAVTRVILLRQRVHMAPHMTYLHGPLTAT